MTESAWPEGARSILHVDMDAFYASVEQREQPHLRGKPVIVGGPRDARGVVSAASYEARRFGVHSAMPLRVAARRCPNGHFVPVRMRLYLQVSRQVFEIFDHYSPLVEPLSVDEAFLDLTGSERLFHGPVETARRIRAEILEECGLTASVGVAPNKFVAKIASDLDKPDGLTVIHPDTVEEQLAPLPIERMWGVGPRGAEALHRLGVRTFQDLASADPDRLRRALGSGAASLQNLARGGDARPVVTARSAKSVGNEVTFSHDVEDEEVIHATLVSLTDKVAGRLRRHGLKARTVTLKLRYAPFRTLTRRKTLDEPTWATTRLLEAVTSLYEERAPDRGAPMRLVGVSTSGFSPQAVLFEEPGAPRDRAVDAAVDAVREKFGSEAVRRASTLRGRKRC
jgi:DNA polymerase-4